MGLLIRTDTSQSRFKLFIRCLNILFAINVYGVLIFNILGVRIPGHSILLAYVPTMFYVVMVWLGFKELAQAKYYSEILKKMPVQHAINAYFIICLIMAVQIPWNLFSASSVITVFSDVVVWLLPVVAVFGLKEENWNVMLKIFCWQTAIASLILLVAIPAISREAMVSDPLHQRLNLEEVGEGILNGSGQLAYASIFLLLSFQSLTTFWRLIALSTAGITLWIALIGQFRSGVLYILLAVAIGIFFIPLRAITTNQTQRKWKAITLFLLISLVFGIGGFMPAFIDNMNARNTVVFQYIEALQKRMETSFSDSGSESGMNLRIEESRQALSEQNPFQLILGKGMGATWSGGTLYNEQRGMLHLGFGHLLQRGGVPLAIFVLLFPFGMALYLLFNSRSQLVIACAGLISLEFTQFFAANIFDLNLSYVMFMLCIGGSLLHLQRKVSSQH